MSFDKLTSRRFDNDFYNEQLVFFGDSHGQLAQNCISSELQTIETGLYLYIIVASVWWQMQGSCRVEERERTA